MTLKSGAIIAVITRCSDFLIHVDPVFGNCFTYNHNRSSNLTSSRAGPMYGLRLIVYVNASEYLPTTEATGVKIVVHEKTAFPFPDTFGYNAPVGYISSFGVKMVSTCMCHNLITPQRKTQ